MGWSPSKLCLLIANALQFGVSIAMVTGINSGGPVLLVYGIIIVMLVSICVGISLSELASALPNAGKHISHSLFFFVVLITILQEDSTSGQLACPRESTPDSPAISLAGSPGLEPSSRAHQPLLESHLDWSAAGSSRIPNMSSRTIMSL